MPIYEEMVIDKKTGKKIPKMIDGKKQYYIRTYIKDGFGNSKQITRHNPEWLGQTGKIEAMHEEVRLKNSIAIQKEKNKNITLSELKNKYIEYIKSHIDSDTLKAKETKLNHFCKLDKTNQVITYPNKKIQTFTKEIYKEWQVQMKCKTYNRGKKNSSGKNKLYSLKHLNNINNEICNMIDFGITEGYCNFNFAKQSGKFGTAKENKMSKVDTIYEIIDYDEYKKLLNVSSDNLKYNTIFDLWFKRGPRPGEVRAFRIMDYSYEKKQLMVNHTMSKTNKLKDPKTTSSKAPIDLDDSINEKINLLITELKKHPNFNDKWYIFNGPTPISSHALDYAKDKYFARAGINKHLRLHDFRHSCATWLFSINVPITVISKILRHANINETLKTYTHLVKKDYEKELERINEM